MLGYLKKKEWSPYVAGTLLGVVYIVSIALTGAIPGASGAFENLAGLFSQVALPDLANNTYFKFVMPPTFGYALILFFGIIVGAFISATLSGDFNIAAVPDEQWKRVFGPSVAKRWIVAFLGGIILEFGAGIAGGCTSGLAVGGGLFLAPSAFVFMGAMFASGIPVAWLFYRRKY